MYHVRHRVYDPARMLWIQRDPLGRIPGANEYADCLGEPIDFYDPMGLWGVGDIGTIASEFAKGFSDGYVEMVATTAHMAVELLLPVSPVETAVKILENAGVDTGPAGDFYDGLDYMRQDAHKAIDDVKTSLQHDPTNPELKNTRVLTEVGNTIFILAAGLPPQTASANVVTLVQRVGQRGAGRMSGRSKWSEAALANDVGACKGSTPNSQVTWVDEGASMPPSARKYNSGAEGARSSVQTQRPQAPQVYGKNGNPVRFDGEETGVLIDRKTAIVTTRKVQGQAIRQSEALRENGLRGVWEVPNPREASRARRMLEKLGIDNIDVREVPL